MIGIIGAMEEEVQAIKQYMQITSTKEIVDCKFYVGNIANQEVVLLQGGIGKVNAAICTSLLITNYDISYIINIGSAGGLQTHLQVGDIIISTAVMHHDVEVTAFGYALGQVPGFPLQYVAEERLLQDIQSTIVSLKLPYDQGEMVSGDQFIAKEEQVTKIKNVFPKALCADMEAASIAQTCYKYQIPFIILRSLSDVFGKGESTVQFDTYLKTASQNSALICYHFIKDQNYETHR